MDSSVAGSNPASGDRVAQLVRAMSLFLQTLSSRFSRLMQLNNFGANAVGTTSVASSNLAGSIRRGRSSVVERLFRQKLVAPSI